MSAKQRQRRKLGKRSGNLQRSDEVIRFIRAPDDRILTMRELKELAENESN
jgi:hypothetical protein